MAMIENVIIEKTTSNQYLIIFLTGKLSSDKKDDLHQKTTSSKHDLPQNMISEGRQPTLKYDILL